MRTFDDALADTEGLLRRQLRGTPAVIRQLTAHLSKASGKNIRAKALLICAMGRDGMIPADAAQAAAAVELLHLATLVHDDIIDDADSRRGIKTLHRKFGEKWAVLCGDYLVCMALELAAAVEMGGERQARVPKTLPGYLTDVLLGELLQDQNLRNYGLTERQYLKIITGKTAAMFEAAFHAGCLLSDATAEDLDTYREIGRNIGIMFQLADDSSDYESTTKKSKKPVLSDYKSGVVTLPLIYALKKDKSLRDRIDNGLEPSALKNAVEQAGGLAYTRQLIGRYFDRTAKSVYQLDITPDKKDKLTVLLSKAAGLPVPL